MPDITFEIVKKGILSQTDAKQKANKEAFRIEISSGNT